MKAILSVFFTDELLMLIVKNIYTTRLHVNHAIALVPPRGVEPLASP